MIAQELEVSLHTAFVEAREARHEYITVEHLLLAMLDNPSAAEVMRACSVKFEVLRKNLVDFLIENAPTVPGDGEVDTQPTLGFQRVIQRAIMHVQSSPSGKKEVKGADVLVAIFDEKDSHAVFYLHQRNFTRLDAVNFMSHGLHKESQTDSAELQNDSIDVYGLSGLTKTHVHASFREQGALMAWNARITHLAAGACEITVPMSAVVTQQHGYFHGGVIGTVADSAGGYAANTLLMPEHECLSAEFKINLLAPGIGDTLIARGKVRKSGKTLVISTVDVFVVKDGVEKLCAIMQQTLFVIKKTA